MAAKKNQHKKSYTTWVPMQENDSRTIPRWTIPRGQFRENNSAKGQFRAGQFRAGQFRDWTIPRRSIPRNINNSTVILSRKIPDSTKILVMLLMAKPTIMFMMIIELI